MLDELKEFEEYTISLETIRNMKELRMRKSNVTEWEKKKEGKYKGKYTGVPRALTIISRYLYYTKGMNPNDIIEILNLWCGFEDNVNLQNQNSDEIVFKFKDWLPKCIKLNLRNKNEAKKLDVLCKDLNERVKHNWNRGAFQQAGSINDKNSIYFESIIADAITTGPLKTRYLVLEKDPKDGFCGKEKDLYDRVLKLLAAYLLNLIHESEYAAMEFVDYSNWVTTGCANNRKVTAIVIPATTYNIGKRKKVPIFSCEYLIPGKNPQGPMISVDHEWMDLYKPKIVLEEDIDEMKDKGYHIFKDEGCGAPLKKLKM